MDREKGWIGRKRLVREKGLELFLILRHERRKFRIIKKDWIGLANAN